MDNSICAKIQEKNNIWRIKTGHSKYIKYAMQKKRSTYSRSRSMS